MKWLLERIREWFATVSVEQHYKDAALSYLTLRLEDQQYSDYHAQINHLVEIENRDLLLDCFYQVMPFWTWWRRWQVWIWPNRINTWTIKSSAQGHSQYLVEKYWDQVKEKWVVICYDVRQYLREDEYSMDVQNPVYGLDCKTLAEEAARVYAANWIKVWMFDWYASTPELSFMIRHLWAVWWDMISASHNPPEFNGKKVQDHTWWQMVPPYDQILVDIVVEQVTQIHDMEYKTAQETWFVTFIDDSDRAAYRKNVQKISLSWSRSVKILFSPFHGTGSTSIYPILQGLDFDIHMDAASWWVDPRFSSILFNIPNPEVTQAYEGLKQPADNLWADIIITTDPDADRIGLMSKEDHGWHFYTGNEICILTTSYILEKYTKKWLLRPEHTLAKTLVTTEFMTVLAREYGIWIEGDLLVWIKYIADFINKLDADWRIDDFLIWWEESHWINMYHDREKDWAVAALLLAEIASECKDQWTTLFQHLNKLYEKFWYYHSYLTEIRLPWAEGMSQIAKIQKAFREKLPTSFWEFAVKDVVDRLDGDDFVSTTDKVSRNIIVMTFDSPYDNSFLKCTVRPSGTEPKTKFYFELWNTAGDVLAQTSKTKEVRKKLEIELLTFAYATIWIDFPERGFLLFWQMPAQQKMKYFDLEEDIAALKDIENKEERETSLAWLLKVFWSNPVEKTTHAFEARYWVSMLEYLELE